MSPRSGDIRNIAARLNDIRATSQCLKLARTHESLDVTTFPVRWHHVNHLHRHQRLGGGGGRRSIQISIDALEEEEEDEEAFKLPLTLSDVHGDSVQMHSYDVE